MKIDYKYTQILEDIMRYGYVYEDPNRKDVFRKELETVHIKHLVQEGFPIVTARKTFFKGAVGELLLFLKGSTDIRDYHNYGIRFWDKDFARYQGYKKEQVDELYKLWKKGISLVLDTGYDMGKIYSYQYKKQHSVFDNFKENPLRTDLIVDSWQVDDLKDMCLIPCFIENTPVCTENGYKNIQDIQIGEKVLTKEGDYRSVYNTMVNDYEGTLIGLDIKGNRDIIKCTPNHEFYIKDKGWTQSLFIEEGDYLGIPINKENIIPEFSYIKKYNSFKEEVINFKIENKSEWFMLGYFVGDGWVHNTKNEICFSINDKEADLVVPIMKNVFKTFTKCDKSGNSYKYKTTSKKYATVLRLFGHKAINKKIPSFVTKAPKEFIEEFLKGYFMADGCKSKRKLNFGTISENLALGVQLLGAKVGRTFTISYSKKPLYHAIQGRKVRQSPKYFQINEIINTYDIIVEDDFVWFKILNKYDYKNIKCKVYNFSVDESHTYTVYNFATHNCHYSFQIVGSEDGFLIVWNQRSTDFLLGTPINIQFYFLMGMLLELWSGHKFNGVVGNLCKVHLYDNQLKLASEMIKLPTSLYKEGVVVKLELEEDLKNLSFSEFIKKIEPSNFKIEDYDFVLNESVEMLTYKK